MKKLAFLLLLLTTISHSQTAGSIDLTFNTNDTGYDIISGTDERVICNKLQSDGKIIIGGNFSKYNGVSANRIARLNSDGSLDTTFNIGTGFTTTSTNQGITEIVLQAEGKIIVAGTFTAYNGIECKDLVRLNTDGTLDTTFNIGTGFNNTINSISVQSDGKIFACGAFTSFNNLSMNYIVKLNSDGSLDNSLDSINLLANAPISDFAIQTNGQIVIIGNFTTYGGYPQNKVARLNPNGSLDYMFNDQGTGFVGTTSCVAIHTGGKIIIGGNFTSYNGISKNHLIRLDIDGTIDTTFNTGTVTGPSSAVTSVNIQSDGKIMILGSFTSYNNINRNKIARLNSSGSLDTSFNIDTNFLEANYFYDPSDVYPSPIFYSISTLTNGKMILAGQFQTNTFSGANIKKINTNGTFDTSFNITSVTGANGPINAIAIQNDGKLIVAGGFSEFNSYLSPGIVRLNVNGTVDSSFLSNFYTKGGTVTTINDISIQSDGKILVIGVLFVDNIYTGKAYLRLNTDGTFDDTFVITTSSNFGFRNSVCLQPDGKLLIGGQRILSNTIKRLNSDGSLDSGFITGTSFDFTVYRIEIQSDGKILVGGGFSSYNGIAKSGIARLNSNGVFDTTFAGTGATGRINAITLQNDGKILIGGAFTSYNGVAANSIIRLNNDGSKDNTFITSIVANVVSINIQPDGKIIIVADISSGSTKKSKIVRLNIDGTIDNSFNSYEVLSEGTLSSSTVHNFTINTSILDANGKLLIGGDFTSYNTTGRNRLARLNAANALSTYETEINSFAIYPNPANDKFTIDFSNDMITNYTIKINNMLGQEVYTNNVDKPQFEVTKTWQGQGIYLVKIYNENKNLVGTKKIILQ
jgi:uncharacterized delta-60 repeat protein